MIFVACVVVLVVGGAILAWALTSRTSEAGASLLGIAMMLVGIVGGVACCVEIVGAGQVGVKTVFGKVDLDTALYEGLNVINPFAAVTEMSIRTETYTMSKVQGEGSVEGDDSIEALSSDDLKCPLDVSVAHRLMPVAAAWVYRNLGPTYKDDLIRPAIRTGVRSGAKGFSAKELRVEKREDAAEAMRAAIDDEIRKIIQSYAVEEEGAIQPPPQVIIVSNVLLRQVGIPDTVADAIEEKLAADQRAQQMEFEILKADKEKEKMQKEGEAVDAYNIAASENLTPDLLMLRGIEATQALAESSNSKVIIIGGGEGGLPVILGGLEASRK